MKLFGGGGEADFENDFMRSRRHSDLLLLPYARANGKERLQKFKSAITKIPINQYSNT
jgi:hypothetical protein